MEGIDLEYLCRVIGNLAGIPVRIYRDKELSFFYSVVDFPADPTPQTWHLFPKTASG